MSMKRTRDWYERWVRELNEYKLAVVKICRTQFYTFAHYSDISYIDSTSRNLVCSNGKALYVECKGQHPICIDNWCRSCNYEANISLHKSIKVSCTFGDIPWWRTTGWAWNTKSPLHNSHSLNWISFTMLLSNICLIISTWYISSYHMCDCSAFKRNPLSALASPRRSRWLLSVAPFPWL